MLILDPKSWRVEAGLTLAAVAANAGIGGANPAKTYSRYETGESPCPATVVEAVRTLSGGLVGAEAFHAARMRFLRQRAEPPEAAAAGSNR
jgi:transcriptional regulator with XRE-family HTH domain